MDTLEAANARIAELEAKLEENKVAVCAACEWRGTKETTWDELHAHLMACEKHPLPAALKREATLEADNAALLGMLGEVDTKFDYMPARLLFAQPHPGAGLLEAVREAHVTLQVTQEVLKWEAEHHRVDFPDLRKDIAKSLAELEEWV